MARYGNKLRSKKELVRQIKELEAEHGAIALLYSARDERHDQAVALRQLIKGAHSS